MKRYADFTLPFECAVVEEASLLPKKCESCDYVWGNFEAGNGRVAFCYPEEGIKKGELVCSMCWKGVEEYYPDEEDES